MEFTSAHEDVLMVGVPHFAALCPLAAALVLTLGLVTSLAGYCQPLGRPVGSRRQYLVDMTAVLLVVCYPPRSIVSSLH
jgi:hypothetical protein